MADPQDTYLLSTLSTHIIYEVSFLVNSGVFPDEVYTTEPSHRFVPSELVPGPDKADSSSLQTTFRDVNTCQPELPSASLQNIIYIAHCTQALGKYFHNPVSSPKSDGKTWMTRYFQGCKNIIV